MANSVYKLTYFNVRARAEPIRFIFAYVKVPYEDNRLDRSKWPSMKNSFPWDQVPILEVDGKILAQSIAITRYLGHKFNLAGDNDFEAAKCDEYMDALSDSRNEWRNFFKETDATKKETLRKELAEIHFPRYIAKFENIVKNNGTGFLVGKKVTWADFTMAHTLEFYEDTVDPKLLLGYPILTRFKENIYAIPEIKAWIEKRPKTPM